MCLKAHVGLTGLRIDYTAIYNYCFIVFSHIENGETFKKHLADVILLFEYNFFFAFYFVSITWL